MLCVFHITYLLHSGDCLCFKDTHLFWEEHSRASDSSGLKHKTDPLPIWLDSHVSWHCFGGISSNTPFIRAEITNPFNCGSLCLLTDLACFTLCRKEKKNYITFVCLVGRVPWWLFLRVSSSGDKEILLW